eukprot:scaffold24606_cov63-Phaeocystis_antarctica.AAC.5
MERVTHDEQREGLVHVWHGPAATHGQHVLASGEPCHPLRHAVGDTAVRPFAPIVKLVTPRQRFPVRLPKATRALSPRTSTAQSHTKLEAATASWSLAWSR